MKFVCLSTALATCFFSRLSAQQQPYFQQEVNYILSVRLDDVNHFLYGDESFEYINNSPDTLSFIYIHLWPNAYKNKSTALAKQMAEEGDFVLFTDAEKKGGYIDSLNFKVNGLEAKWEPDENNIDICKLIFDNPVQPGQKVTVTTPFRVKIPDGSISRLGHIDQSYQITQWYPKPAVYDKKGWHQMPYLTQGEFYSEFGSFDVSITLPSNYVVGATGDLQNESEKKFLDSLATLGTNRPEHEKGDDFPLSSSAQKTLRFVQHNVHDFGWFADKRWMVLKGEVITPHTKNKVTIWAMFTPENAVLWGKAPEYIHDAVHYYSLWNGDYPYRQVTAVDGTISAGGGMEYPNITVIGNTSNARMLETVIMHEVGHNWFYGMLGSNERDHAWMDEGLNSFNEERYLETKYPETTAAEALGINIPMVEKLFKDYSQRTITELSYTFNARRSMDQPLSYTSSDFTQINYGGMVYKKSALIFQYLRSSLGDELFDRCARSYFNQWKYKHPQPEDMREVYERISGKDLSWFFDQLINTTAKVDFKLTSARLEKDAVYVKVKNKGRVEGPFPVSLLRDGNIMWTVWSDPLAKGKTSTVKLPFLNGADKVKIDAGRNLPEIYRTNNVSRLKGIFKRAEPVDGGFFTFLENPDKAQFFFVPLVGWNQYNRWMTGLNFHNRLIPQKRFEWSVSPLYSFHESNLNGFASFIYRSNRWEVGVKGQKFNSVNIKTDRYDIQSAYAFAEPYIGYSFNNRLKGVSNSFSGSVSIAYQYVYLFSDVMWHLQEGGETQLTSCDRENFLLRAYLTKALGFRSKIAGKFSANAGTDFIATGNLGNTGNVGNLLSADIHYDWRYSLKKKYYLTVRGFFGYTMNDDTRRYVWNVAGATGSYDFFYEQLYLGRSEASGLLSRQIGGGQGFLAVPTAASATKKMSALNITFRLPTGIPVAVYGGFANAFSPLFHDTPHKTGTYWSAGVSLPLVRDVLEIYLPVVNSSNINEELKVKDIDFFGSIMFRMNINMMNPFEIIHQINP
ncbi:MAG: M1 family metallopeptidase [Crocinitomicaceae bacterium]|nr:M1 family metallopeptidase [Crocinitomicaceae bacterium]